MTSLTKISLVERLVAVFLVTWPIALTLPAQAKDICPQDYPSYISYADAITAKSRECQSITRAVFRSDSAYLSAWRTAGCDYESNCTKVSRKATPKQPAKVEETYNIDSLQIIHTKWDSEACAVGAMHSFQLKGVIGPDSTFAMTRLLKRNLPCTAADGSTVTPPVIYLNSDGGLLGDGYALGREFRRLGISVAVSAEKYCASSCAVAFLGGKRRLVADDGLVVFHAPYFAGKKNEAGSRDISCDVGDTALEELRAYYREMTDAEIGDRLFDRTMWYCSAEDGWVVKGGSAAELYGIATEK